MDSLSLFVLCFAFTSVNCMAFKGTGDSNIIQLAIDLCCLQRGMNAIEGQTVDAIHNRTQQEFGEYMGMAMQRAGAAAQAGYTCYQQSYSYFGGQLGPALDHLGEQSLLAEANVRYGAVKGIYAYSQLSRCDEDWRINTFPTQLDNSRCSESEQAHYTLIVANYESNLAKLNDPLFVDKFVHSETNPIVAELMKTRMINYQVMYNNALTCCQGLSSLADRCKCIKLQTYELGRDLYMLFYPKLLPKLQALQG